MKKQFWHALTSLLLIIGIFLSVRPIEAGGETPFTMRLVSHTPPGQAGNDFSDYGYPSAMGQYVVFSSLASDLVSDDTNGVMDVFLYDTAADTIERISLSSTGTELNNTSIPSAISTNGRYIAFSSYAPNVVENDTNKYADAFLYDRVTGTTTRVSIAADGSEPNDYSWALSVSDDGQQVLFYSYATNLVANDTNQATDLFVRNLATSETTRVSVGTGGVEADFASTEGKLSADGQTVVFGSYATNLAPSDTNEAADVFVRDLTTGITTLVSVASNGDKGNNFSNFPAISADGRFVSFYSVATNLVPNDTNVDSDVFWHDRVTGETRRVSVTSDGTQSNGASFTTSLSGNGRYVAFYAYASNLVENDTNTFIDIFVHDTLTSETWRASVAEDGTEANGGSGAPQISNEGQAIAFFSNASNLAAGDTNEVNDIYLYQVTPPTPTETPTPSLTPTESATATPSATATTAPTTTATASPTITPTTTPTISPTNTATVSPTTTPTPTLTATAAPPKHQLYIPIIQNSENPVPTPALMQ